MVVNQFTRNRRSIALFIRHLRRFALGVKKFAVRSLDRIDNNKGYYKANCRWATYKEQNNNKTHGFLKRKRSNNGKFIQAVIK